jgi:hypothetical protein
VDGDEVLKRLWTFIDWYKAYEMDNLPLCLGVEFGKRDLGGGGAKPERGESEMAENRGPSRRICC